MKQQLLAAALGLALVAPLAAHAEGAYVGVNVGSTDQKASTESAGSAKDTTTGYKLYGGYNFTKNFGLEAGYVDFGKSSGTFDTGAKLTAKPTAVYVAVTGNLPLSDEFSLFAKVGVSANHTKIDSSLGATTSDNTTSTLLGIGAAYNLSRNFALVAEYEDFGKISKDDGADLKANLLSIGVRYKF